MSARLASEYNARASKIPCAVAQVQIASAKMGKGKGYNKSKKG
jgi:hypothetical protein